MKLLILKIQAFLSLAPFVHDLVFVCCLSDFGYLMSCDIQVSHSGCVSTAWAVTNQCDGEDSTERENIQCSSGLLLVGTHQTRACTGAVLATCIHIIMCCVNPRSQWIAKLNGTTFVMW